MENIVRLTRNYWLKLLELDRLFRKQGKHLSKNIIKDIFKLSDRVAYAWSYALKYKDIIALENEKITTNDTVVVFLSDLHIPYQDNSAISALFEFLKDKEIHYIIILGDFIDFYQISKYVKNPVKKSISEEIKETALFLKNLREVFSNIKIILLKGNHEERLEKYIMENASHLYDLLDNLLEIKLGLRELDIEYFVEPFQVGKLWCLHGHEKPIGSYNPEHICNIMWKYIHENFICGHFHRNQSKEFKNISGEVFWTVCVGYLGQPMEYMKLNNWGQGFAIAKFANDGNFQINLHKIYNGVVY